MENVTLGELVERLEVIEDILRDLTEAVGYLAEALGGAEVEEVPEAEGSAN
jgi:hypothetical protein